MAKNILDGSADLVALNLQSLQLRGKEKKSKSGAKGTKSNDKPRISGAIKKDEPKSQPSSRERYTQTTLGSSFRPSASKKSGIPSRRQESLEVLEKEED